MRNSAEVRAGEGSTGVARRNGIDRAFVRAVRKYPHRTALRFGERTWTYARLEAAAGSVAARLETLGLGRGDRVAAYGRNSDAYLLLWLACVRGGFVHVPINYALTAAELTYIVAQSRSAALVYDADLEGAVGGASDELTASVRGRFEGAGERLDVLAAAERCDAYEPAVSPAADDLVQLLYTSGTTAAPKGAMMTHGALLAEYESCIVDADHRCDDRVLAALPLYHSAQMHVFAMPQLLLGATMTLLPAFDPAACLRVIEAERINSFFAPPTGWIALLRHADFATRDLASLEKIYYGASIMPVPVLEELRRRLPRAAPYNLYGQSEIGPLATVLRPEEHAARPASAGRPVFNVETRIVDPDMNDVAPGINGELVHRSPQLMVGYWDKPAETAEAFAGGWFHSGDVGWRDEDGYITIADRIKDVINTGGVVVSSREVEDVLFTHPEVSEAAVVSLPHPKWVEAIAAIVVLRPGATIDEAALGEHARAGLASFKVPKRIFFVAALPRNTAGKILKRALRDEYADRLNDAP
ncbi:MAG: acyl-CoA synthetase [Vulcanimicrobiaceae bacterium]